MAPSPGALRAPTSPRKRGEVKSASSGKKSAYAFAMSGKTASILVFSVAALNGLTM
jgi:hypothetical protein